jgi:predicted phosphodiesterase
MKAVPFLLVLGILLTACDAPSVGADATSVALPQTGAAHPWTHDSFDSDGNKFTFAIHSDLTGGERDDIYEVAIAQLNLLRPEFIINVGDLIEGDPEEAVVDEQWDSFDERASRAKAPVFYVGGNHDRTGKLLQDVWSRRQGPGYYHFRYKDVLFLVLDTEDNTPERMQEIEEMRSYALQFAASGEWDKYREAPYSKIPENQAGNISEAQSRYMIDTIAANPDVRWTFLLVHKAPWLREDLTAFTDIEDALADRPYTVFHGHVHAYQHHERRGRDYIRLATTGGVQLPEYGRSMDHVTLVTVDDEGVDIANLLMNGILDKTGRIPLNGEDLCFESTNCPQAE